MISKAIYQIITDEILDSIKSGILKPGDNIPSIRDIKEKYKVSSITALRVFKELTNGGYIIRKHGSGYFVAEKNLPTKALMLICGIHPPVDFNDYDNWGNRINAGIVQECLESRMGLYYPAAIGVLRNGSVAHNGAEVLGASIAESVSTAGGVLIDWRFTDKEIEKYIIPAAGKVPLVLIGRRSRLPKLN